MYGWEHRVKRLLSLCYGSKLVLLTAWRVSKLRDQVLGQGRETLFGKPADWEDGGRRLSQRTIFPELELNLLLYWKGEGCDWLLQTSWRPLHSVRVGQVTWSNLQPDRCYSLLFNFLSRYEWANVIPLKVRALRMTTCIFQAIGNILTAKAIG